VADYVGHRIAVAGGRSEVFSSESIRQVYRISKGIPRLINLLCDRALLGTYSQNELQVTATHIKQAATEILDHREATSTRLWQRWGIAAAIVLTFGIIVTELLPHSTEPAIVTTAPLVTPTAPPPTRPVLASDGRLVNDKKILSKGYLDRESAITDLIVLWGTPTDLMQTKDATSPCEQATAFGLQCYRGSGELTELQFLNRASVIGLRDEDNKQRYFTLTSLDNDVALISIGTTGYPIPRSLLQSRWDGEFNLLWRMPPAYKAPLQPGETGPMVPWLASQLSPDIRFSDTYDQPLEEEVRAFQNRVGLQADGVVDPITWIQINSIQGLGVPFLDTTSAYSKGQN